MPAHPWCMLVAGAVAAGFPARLAAQLPAARFDAELGAAVVRQPGVPALAAPTLGGAWAWTGARTVVRADGVAAVGADAWSGQLAASASQFVGDADAPYELGVQARAAHLPAARATAQLLGGARRHLTFGGPLVPTSGGWIGGLVGATTGVRAGGAAPVLSAAAGVWRTLTTGTRVVATAAWTATRADSAALATAAPPNAPPATGMLSSGATRVETLDATAAVERVGAHVELAATTGARRITVARGAEGGARWGALATGAMTWWVRPGVGLVAGAGTQPADPGRGLPAVQYVACTLRLRPHARIGTAGAPAIVAAAATAPTVTVAADDSRVLHVVAAGAVRVRVRAAATRWRAVDLAPGPNGTWVLTPAWPAGAHRLAVRVNEDAWRPPANVPAVDDEYGGRVGLLVIP